MRNLILILLCFISSIGFSQTAEEYMEMSENAFSEEKIKDMEKYAREALALSPTPEAYLYISISLDLQEKFDESVQVLNEGLEAFPESSILYGRRGLILRFTHNFNAAIREYTKAIEYAEDDSTKYYWMNDRGWVKSLLQDYEGAYADTYAAYRFDTTDVAYINNMAMFVEGLGYPDSSIYYLEKSLQYDSTNVAIYSNIGFTYQMMEEYEKSLPYFDRAIELDPKESYAYNNRSYSRLMSGDVKGALKDVNKSIKLFSANSYAYRNRGMIYIEMGKEDKACKDFNTALALDYTRSYGNDVEEMKRKHCR